MADVDPKQSDEQGSQACRDEPQHRFAAHAAHGSQVPQFGNPDHEGGKHQRRDYHLDQAQKDGGQKLDIGRECLDFLRIQIDMEHITHHDSQNHGNENEEGEDVSAFHGLGELNRLAPS